MVLLVIFEFIQHTAAILPPALSPQTAIFEVSIGNFEGLLLIQLMELIASSIAVGNLNSGPIR